MSSKDCRLPVSHAEDVAARENASLEVALGVLAARSGHCSGWCHVFLALEDFMNTRAGARRAADRAQIESIRAAGFGVATAIDRTDWTVRPARRSPWQELRGIMLPLDDR